MKKIILLVLVFVVCFSTLQGVRGFLESHARQQDEENCSIKCMAWDPSGRFIVLGFDEKAEIWNIEKGRYSHRTDLDDESGCLVYVSFLNSNRVVCGYKADLSSNDVKKVAYDLDGCAYIDNKNSYKKCDINSCYCPDDISLSVQKTYDNKGLKLVKNNRIYLCSYLCKKENEEDLLEKMRLNYTKTWVERYVCKPEESKQIRKNYKNTYDEIKQQDVDRTRLIKMLATGNQSFLLLPQESKSFFDVISAVKKKDFFNKKNLMDVLTFEQVVIDGSMTSILMNMDFEREEYDFPLVHTDCIHSLAWCKTSFLLASASKKEVVIWDMKKMCSMRVLNNLEADITSIAWQPGEGKRLLAIGLSNGMVRFYVFRDV